MRRMNTVLFDYAHALPHHAASLQPVQNEFLDICVHPSDCLDVDQARYVEEKGTS